MKQTLPQSLHNSLVIFVLCCMNMALSSASDGWTHRIAVSLSVAVVSLLVFLDCYDTYKKYLDRNKK